MVECVVLQEKQYKKAAEELGVSVNTIKTLLRQGIKELRERLKGKRECIFFLMLDLWHFKQVLLKFLDIPVDF